MSETAIHVLLLEDSPLDADLIVRALTREGMVHRLDRVDSESAYIAALERGGYDVILADYAVPGFDGITALALAREMAADIPFVMVSGAVGEELAVDAIRRGAADYVLKQRLVRLPLIIRRVLEEATVRRAREHGEAELRRTDAALARNAAELDAIVESLPDAVLVFTETGLARCNHAGLDMLGFRTVAELGVAFPTFASSLSVRDPDTDEPIAQQDLPFAAALAGAVVRRNLRLHNRRNDRELVVACAATPIVSRGQRIAAAAVFSDITDRDRAARAVRALNEELEERVAERTRQLEAEMAERQRAEEALRQSQKMEAVGQLTGGVAHDFNNLLTVLQGNLDLLSYRYGSDPQAQRLIDGALKASERGQRLTAHLLAFARRQQLRPETVAVDRLVREFAPLLQRALGETIAFDTSLSVRDWTVDIDAAQLESALLNLAVNARDAMPGGGRLTISTAERSAPGDLPLEARHGDYVEIAVTDDGTGMSPDVVERAFEPFFTTKDVGKGSGLGLSQVYGFVRQSGGWVDISSTLGSGTRIRLLLPRSRAAAAAEHAAASRAARRGSERVLVVEDDTDVRTYVHETLLDLGYDVVTAASAQEGLGVLQNDAAIDLLFSDVVMPGGMTGVDLAHRAMEVRPGLRVLLTSGYNPDLASASELPLLLKPYRRAELAQKLRELLDSPRAPANQDGPQGIGAPRVRA